MPVLSVSSSDSVAVVRAVRLDDWGRSRVVRVRDVTCSDGPCHGRPLY